MIKIRAHNCEVITVDPTFERTFLNENHYQGYVPSTICYGLLYKDEVVMVMSFGKPRYNKRYDSELLRLCTKKDHQVYGGASKLFKEILSNENIGSVISYCNEDLFSGKVYEALGFTKRTIAKGYHYEKDGKSYSRQNFQKWRCLKLWPEFVGQDITEREIMRLKGYTRIDDTKGQSTWTYGLEFKWYIYRIEINSYVYIGQHKYTDINEPYYGSGTILKRVQKIYKTHGNKTIIYQDIESQEEANRLEIEEIKKAKAAGNCINILDGGTGYVKVKRKYVSQGHKQTEEWKKEHSERMKQLWDSGLFNGTRGKTHEMSQETKQKISDGNKGKKRTDEQKKKMSEAHKGLKHTEEQKRKTSEKLKQLVAEGKHHCFEKGHEITDDVRAKISKAMSDKKAVYVKFDDGSVSTTKEIAEKKGATSGKVAQYIKTYGYIVIEGTRRHCELISR